MSFKKSFITYKETHLCKYIKPKNITLLWAVVENWQTASFLIRDNAIQSTPPVIKNVICYLSDKHIIFLFCPHSINNSNTN